MFVPGMSRNIKYQMGTEMSDIRHRLLRRPQVEEMTGLSRSSIYEKMNDGTFPKCIKIGEKAVSWIEQEVQDWIRAQIERARGT
jgi:prophage regulatory protein